MIELKNKNVIIVGPSSYLEGRGCGEFIDSFDTVVRINNLHDTNDPQLVKDLGKRTDIVYYDGSVDNKRFNSYLNAQPQGIICTYPETEWFFEERCRGVIEALNPHFNNRVVDSKLYTELKQNLDPNMKVRPNSGLVAIVDLLTTQLKQLYITGIDFYRNSYANYYPDYGNLDLDSVKKILRKGDNGDIHDINKQFKYFKNVVSRDIRIKTDEVLGEYLTNPKYETVTF